MHHLIVIGGGPAALAAAVYALDKHLDVRIIAEELGGKVGLSRSVTEHRAAPGRVSEENARLFERAIRDCDLVLRDRVVEVTEVNGHFGSRRNVMVSTRV